MSGRRWVRMAIALGVLLVAASLVVPFVTLPHRRLGDVIWLDLESGHTIVVRNLDDEVHQVAGIAARPGETVLHTFRERGVFSDERSLDITVFVEVGRR